MAFGQFSDNDLHRAFDEDIKSSHSTALRMMAEFAQEFIDPNLWLQLVRCLIDMIDLDSEISDDTEFFITADSTATKSKCIPALDHFYIEPFLLGVWHYIIMNRSDDNEKGADTYKQWYLGKGDYRGTVGNGIVQSIMVESLPVVAFENTDTINNSSVEEPEAEVVGSKDSTQENAKSCTQYIENATIVNQNGEKNIHIDHVDTLNL
ncbi:MAG: hypothetical protein RR370_03095 [Synergistaceae bacterium]